MKTLHESVNERVHTLSQQSAQNKDDETMSNCINKYAPLELMLSLSLYLILNKKARLTQR